MFDPYSVVRNINGVFEKVADPYCSLERPILFFFILFLFPLRTGLYCAASFVVDKIKTEQGVDVFHAVRSIRLSRGGFVENLDQ